MCIHVLFYCAVENSLELLHCICYLSLMGPRMLLQCYKRKWVCSFLSAGSLGMQYNQRLSLIIGWGFIKAYLRIFYNMAQHETICDF